MASNIVSFFNTSSRSHRLCYPEDKSHSISPANVNRLFASESYIHYALLFTAHVRQDTHILRSTKLHYYFLQVRLVVKDTRIDLPDVS